MGDLIAAESRAPSDQVNRLESLLEQLRAAEEPLAALHAANLNIADLMRCSGAAILCNGQTLALGRCHEIRLQPLVDQLEAAAGVGTGRAQLCQLPAESGAPGKDTDQTVLAVPFNRAQSGWLVWWRHSEVSGAAGWTAADIQTAEQLRSELLEVLLERAQSMGALQRRLISSLGHGLCNPLQSISMSAALLKAQDKRSVELRSHISLASESMERQINRMLEVNRLHGGERLRINPVEGNLSNLVASEASRARNAAPGLEMQASIETDVVTHFDPERLAQAIRHLLNNAQQNATADTPVRLLLRREAETDDVLLSIGNHCTQLDPARFNSLFSAIKPGGAATQRGNRLGIGLYVTANIVRAHGGQISAQQQDGLIEFRLRLPAQPARQAVIPRT